MSKGTTSSLSVCWAHVCSCRDLALDRNGRERETRTKSVLVLKMLERIIFWRCDGELLVDRVGRNWFLCVWFLCADRLLLCGALLCFAFRFCPAWLVCVVGNINMSVSHHSAYDAVVLMFRVLIQFAL